MLGPGEGHHQCPLGISVQGKGARLVVRTCSCLGLMELKEIAQVHPDTLS